MIEKLRIIIVKFLTVNITLKLLSLFLAIFLWFLVLNINNPTEVKTFSLNLTLLNESTLEDNSMILLNKEELTNTKIQVKIKATRQALSELNQKVNRDQILAYIDLSQFKYLTSLDKSEVFTSNIDVKLPSMSYSYDISNIDPLNLKLTIDKQSTISKKVNVKKIGNLGENYAVTDVNISTEYVQITGASTILDNIETVFVEVDINNATSNIKASVSPVAYDNQGNKVEGISFNPQEITLVAPVYSKMNIEVLEPVLKGSLADGYVVSNISYSPKNFSIFALENEISSINTSISPVLDVSNLSENKTFTFDIKDFFENKNIYYESQNKISVELEIEQEKIMDISINVNDIVFENISEDYDVKVTEDILTLKIKGRESALSSINIKEIIGKVDLGSLEKGTHSLKVSFNIPENVDQVQDVILTLNINDKEAQSQILEKDDTEP